MSRSLAKDKPESTHGSNMSPADTVFSNRFQGKQERMSKEGHYGVVSKASNPIKKGTQSDLMLASQHGPSKTPMTTQNEYKDNTGPISRKNPSVFQIATK